MSRLNGLAHIGIKVRDVDASCAFYVEKMGFEKTGEETLPTCRLVFVRQGSCTLELISADQPLANAGNVIAHVCLEVKGIEDEVRALEQKGVAVHPSDIRDMPLFGGSKNVFFKGPDGEVIELFDFLK